MELLLLGTGGPRGWPEPGCRCASCATAVATRTFRAPTSALLDGVLLLDPGPDAARLAAAAGRDLSGIRAVLRSDEADALEVPYAVHGLRQGDRTAWDVTAPDGRLLYAPGDATVTDATGPYDVVLLGGLPETLAGLRRSGAVHAGTDVVAVGLGHDAPADLDRLLAAWGARAVPDGTVLGTPRRTPALTGRTLVLGGARSGKSALAEQLLSASPDVTYVATGGTRDGDPEWAQRVRAHVRRRPSSWRTVETSDVAGCLRGADGPLLVDCLGTWLAGRLDARGVWEGAAAEAVDPDLDELVAAWRDVAVPVVAVSNEVGSGVVPGTASGRLFRDLLGRLNAAIARESETVLLTVAGLAVPLREPGRP